MEFLSKYIAQIRAHLGGLSASQRVALVLSSVLVAIAVIWLVRWSAEPQRVPLLDQPLTAEEQSRIEDQLGAIAADYKIENGQVWVSQADRARLRARLAQARALPANTSMSFARLMDDNNPFLAREDSRWRKARALEAELSGVLTYFDGIHDAKVFVQMPQRRSVGGPPGRATASVYVKPQPGAALNAALVASIADFVSGAVEGLMPDAVHIVDATSGRSHRVPGPEDAMPFDVLALRRQREEHYARKITEHLGYIPGVLVGVHAELNLEKKSVQDLKLGKPVVSEEENNSTSSSRGAAGAGPGVKPNVGRAVSGGGGEESMSREDSRSKFDGRRDETVTQIVLMPGDVRRLTASINVPRSYFVGVYRQVNPQKDEPKDADLTPIITAETKKIRGQVRSLIAASSDDQVDVDWFYDTAVATSGPGGGPAAAAMSGAGAGGYFGPAWDYAPQAGLALLALMSLAVVLRMARRSQAAIVAAGQAMERRVRVEQEAVAARLEKLDTNVDVAGEAASTEMVLEGHELAEDEVRVQHLVDQIGQMVKDDSNTAASLVEQWVGASRL